MYGNGMNNPFMMSNMYGPINNMMSSSMMRSAPMMGNTVMRSAPMMGGTRSGGLLSSLFGGRGASGLSQGLRSFNFGSLLNNTSKALGVVREAIPIVKEVGPMVGNMKQMLKIASIFKDETDTTTRKTTSTETVSEITTENKTTTKENDTNITSITINSNNNTPNFFL